MMTLIIGGSGSGKSAYAERYITSLVKGSSFPAGGRENDSPVIKKYYLATMQAFDEESRKRIERHRKQRRGRGFLTIEQPVAIWKAAENMEPGEKAALLECISNLTANEMFTGSGPKAESLVAEDIVKGIAFLKEKLTHLVVVSNNVFEDGRIYDESTMAYLWAMGKINEQLAEMADEVVEVVVGIPVIIK